MAEFDAVTIYTGEFDTRGLEIFVGVEAYPRIRVTNDGFFAGDGTTEPSPLGGDFVTTPELEDAISDLIASAPGGLDTLNELAAAMSDDPNFASSVAAAIGSEAASRAFADDILETDIENLEIALAALDAEVDNKQPLDADLTAWAGKTAPSGAAVGTTDSQTLTNKTINAADNTITGLTEANFDSSSDSLRRNIRIGLDGAGLVITTGEKKVYISVPYNCVIEEWRILADTVGSIVIDIWKDTYANFPPLVGSTITAAAKPTLTTAQKAESSVLTGWTTTINAGDILEVTVDSATDVGKIFLDLKVRLV